MARRPRRDTPGSWHHVMNRAIARRSMFETRADIRFFLAGVARAVHRGEIEVHAWCVLTTHFHMLIRSPKGEISTAMRRIQNAYVRRFNRMRRRDGTLLGGRFRSKLVDSIRYRELLVRYIDANPVRAGLCADSRDHPWGSARQYAQPSGPPWLSRTWVESWFPGRLACHGDGSSQSPKSFDAQACDRVASLVESRLASTSAQDELDSLIEMAPPEILRWMRCKAMLADGGSSTQPCVASASVTDTMTMLEAKRGGWKVSSGRQAVDGWRILHAGLLRDLAGATFVTIARILRVSREHARRLSERHHKLLREDEIYGRTASNAMREVLDGAFAVN